MLDKSIMVTKFYLSTIDHCEWDHFIWFVRFYVFHIPFHHLCSLTFTYPRSSTHLSTSPTTPTSRMYTIIIVYTYLSTLIQFSVYLYYVRIYKKMSRFLGKNFILFWQFSRHTHIYTHTYIYTYTQILCAFAQKKSYIFCNL